MLESKVQAAIIKHLQAMGWTVVKLIQTNMNGIPDLLCLKNGVSVFLEVKNETGRPSKLQEFRIKKLQENGFRASVVRDKAEASRICEEI